METLGLKKLRKLGYASPKEPNRYHRRPKAEKCVCGFRVRGNNHETGTHHRDGCLKASKK